MNPRRRTVIKGSSLPVLRIVARDGDAHAFHTELVDAIEQARPLLADAIAVLDLRELHSREADRSAIVEAVRAAGVRLAAVLIGEAHERAALARVGLPVLEAPLSTRERSGGSVDARPGPDATPDEPPIERPVARTVARQGTGQPARPGLAPLYLTKPLRSGQRFYAQGRDAVVAAPTSRGSELIADGSIYAFSPIRGRVLAGASGDASACIVATHLDAELIAVAGVYRTLEPDDLKGHAGVPVSVTLWIDSDGNERLRLATLALSSSPT